jgi:hypothetical protein
MVAISTIAKVTTIRDHHASQRLLSRKFLGPSGCSEGTGLFMEIHCDVLHRLGISLAKSYQRLAEAKGHLTEAANIFEQISILHTSIGKHREDCAMCRSVDAAVHEGMQISRPLNHIQ